MVLFFVFCFANILAAVANAAVFLRSCCYLWRSLWSLVGVLVACLLAYEYTMCFIPELVSSTQALVKVRHSPYKVRPQEQKQYWKTVHLI
jgi:hypothetical protein